MVIAQVILFLDEEGKLHAEMPNLNGGPQRMKLALSDFDCDLLSTTGVIAALNLQKEKYDKRIARKRELEEEENEARSRRVFLGIAQTHGEELAQRAVPGLKVTPKTLRRVAPNPCVTLGKNTQNETPVPKAKREKPAPKVSKLDF